MERLNMRDLRGARSLREVAQDLGITPQMLGKIELKRRTPSLGLAQKIANYYGVMVEQIFFAESRDELSLKGEVSNMDPGPKPAA